MSGGAPSIEQQLINHEGLRQHPYRCTAGKLSIGVGRNLDDVGITAEEAYFLLFNDIAGCKKDLQDIFPAWATFSIGRQWALIDLRFNLGPVRFRGFNRMIAAIRTGDWSRAAAELKESLWWTQVQDARKLTLGRQLLTGEK